MRKIVRGYDITTWHFTMIEGNRFEFTQGKSVNRGVGFLFTTTESFTYMLGTCLYNGDSLKCIPIDAGIITSHPTRSLLLLTAESE